MQTVEPTYMLRAHFITVCKIHVAYNLRLVSLGRLEGSVIKMEPTALATQDDDFL